MSETHEEGSTIARYIARFRQAQPQAPEQRRRTPREEFWWVQTRPDADKGGGLNQSSVAEDAEIVPSASSVASSSLSSWRTLDQSHEEADNVVSPAPVVADVAVVPVQQETPKVVQVDVEKEERKHHAPLMPDLDAASEEKEQAEEDDEDAESVIQRVRERLGWHGSSSSQSSLGSMSLTSSSLFASPLAYAGMDSVASSLDCASAASCSSSQLDEAVPIKRSVEPAIRTDPIRYRWPEEEEEEEKASLASSNSSRQEQQMNPSHLLQTNSQEVNASEAENKEHGFIAEEALVETDHYELLTEVEVLPQDTGVASLAETQDALDLVPSLAPSKSPVPLKRSFDADLPGMQAAPFPASSSSSFTSTIQEAVATVDSSGDTTAETAQTLDRLVSFVVQSWSKDLFESDDPSSPIARTQKMSAMEADASCPSSEQEETNSTHIDAADQDLSLVESPSGVEASQATAVEMANSDILVANTEDEAAEKETHEKADDGDDFEDDEVACMLRQRIALYEEALRRIE